MNDVVSDVSDVSVRRAQPGWGAGAATGIGSMPGEDAREAARTVMGELQALPVFSGRVQRKYTASWLRHLQAARALPASELPSPSQPTDGPPPVNRWADKDPDAAARLSAARAALTAIAEDRRLPVENLLLPDLVRRTCWRPPASPDEDTVAAVLRAGGARPWQIELTVTALSKALKTTAS